MATACFAHPALPSVVSCQICTRGLCTHCEQNVGALCHACTLAGARQTRSEVLKRFLAVGLVGAWFIWLAIELVTTPHHRPHVPLLGAALAFYLGAAVVYGASVVRSMFRGWILSLPLWLLVVLVQIALAIVIGAAYAPIGVASDLRALSESQKAAARVPR